MSNWITDNKPAAMVAGVGLLNMTKENQRRLQGDQIRQRR